MPRKVFEVLVGICASLFAMSAMAQNARFTGRVTDAQAAAIPGATVQVISKETGTILTLATDATGTYTVPYLTAGHYRIVVQMAGFNQSERDDLLLGVGQALLYDVKLTVGGESTSVRVEGGGATELQLDNAEVSGTITGKEVTSIGLNGRNFTQFIALAPGVSNQTQQDEAKVGGLGSVAYSVNGGRTEYNSFQVDGAETLNTGINKDHSTLIVYPSIDAIQEIKVLTSNYGAQYPSTGSGTTLFTTRSGTDEYHGTLYEFLRNEALNAKGYFDVTKGPPLYRRNDFGGSIGGPLTIPHFYNARGKTHFFFSEEARLEKTPTAYRQAVPTLAERNGDFNDVCPQNAAVIDRAKYPDCPASDTFNHTFQQNQLNYANAPGSTLNRNGVALLNTGIIPNPNATSGCNSPIGSCYNVDVSLPTYWREELFRLDHALSLKTQLSFRYVHDEWDTTTPVPQYAFTQNSFPTIQNRYYEPGRSLIARVTNAFTNSLLNEIVVGYTNSVIELRDLPERAATITRAGTSLDAACATDRFTQQNTGTTVYQCPITSIFDNGYGGKIPGVVIAGNNAAYGGNGFAADPGYAPWQHSNPTYSVADNLTKVLGRHSVQAGAQATNFQRNQTNGPIGAATGDTQGLLVFNNIKSTRSTGNAFADLLYHSYNPAAPGADTRPDLGFSDSVASFQQDSQQARYRQRYTIVEPYIQDDWKASQHLTINAGVRFSLFGTYSTANRNIYNWLPPGVKGGFSNALAGTVHVDDQFGQLVDNNSGVSLQINPSAPGTNLDARIVNGISQCGVNGVPSSCMSGHLFNVAPRVGFAWDPTGKGKSVIRAGYGIFFEHGTADEANSGSLEASAPIVLSMTQENPTSYSTIGGGLAFPLSVTAIPTEAVWPYVQQWSLSIERELPKNFLFMASYVGSKGTHLTAERELNQLAPLAPSNNPLGAHEPLHNAGVNQASNRQGGDCSGFDQEAIHPVLTLKNGTRVDSSQPSYLNLEAACFGAPGSTAPNPETLRSYAPGIGQIYSLENIANSAYNSMQLTLRRTQGPLNLGVAYTYSHSIDNASDRSDSTFVNSFDLHSSRSSSNFDQRHLLHISYVYELPLLSFWRSFASILFRDPDPENEAAINRPPSAFATTNLAKNILNGWQLSGITLFETGIPFTVVNNGSPENISTLDNAGVANGVGSGSYPDLSGVSPHSARPLLGNNAASVGPLLLNPAAFVAPRGLTFGNAGRNVLNNPRRWNFDLSVLKNLRLPREGDSIQFRAEAFNLFNHTEFRIYDPVLGTQANNTVSCYGGYTAGYSAAGGDGTDCLTGSSFLHPVDAHRPRTIQLAVKLSF